ncbi:hypothetical protein AB0G95_38265 [Streptomyces virginiae]|uniref:hypothetical protein n=1 Tax=Streptomyces virginiae TaxID=1961 RepID=UPI00343D6253
MKNERGFLVTVCLVKSVPERRWFIHFPPTARPEPVGEEAGSALATVKSQVKRFR